jgi:glycosyltransferase involved in cell wall biosynthesis
MSKGKILLLNYEYPPLGGGGGVASRSLARGWVNLGYQVLVVTSRFQEQKKIEQKGAITIHRVTTWGRSDQFTASFLSLVSYLFFGFFKSLHLALKHKLVFINTHFVVPTGPLGWLISKLFRCPNLLSIHGGDIYDPSKKSSPHQSRFYRFLIRKLLSSKGSQVIAQSNNTKVNAQKYYHSKAKIKVIPLAYEAYNFKPKTRKELGLSADKFYLVSTGRLVERKGYQYLLAALKNLPAAIELIVIGSGPLMPKLQSRAQDLGIELRVKFLGYTAEELKFQYLNSANLYVLSSLHEGFGIVLQEAMQVGLPIVSTDHGGQTDFITPEQNGLLVPIKDSQSLEKAIFKLYNDPKLGSEMSNNNRQAIKQFSPLKIANQYLQLLNE